MVLWGTPMRALADRRLGVLGSDFRKNRLPGACPARSRPLLRAAGVVLLRLGDRREPLPQILRAGRGMQLAGIRLPGSNLGPHHVAFTLGVGPGLEVVQGAKQVITLAPARLAGPLLQVG